MSTCSGLRGSFGCPRNKKNRYHIEPLDATKNTLHQPHALHLAEEYKTSEGTCGCNQTHSRDEDIDLSFLSDDLVEDLRLKRQASQQLRVEMIIVNDNAQFVAQGRSLSTTVQRACAVVNNADSLFAPFNIDLIMIQSITWNQGNQVGVSTNAETTLDNMNAFRSNLLTNNRQHDNMHLLTGLDLDGTTIGLAFVGTMCGSSSVGLTQDGGRSLEGVGATLAHELGHNFNINHDDDTPGCAIPPQCNDPVGRCIMSAVSASGQESTQWSSCSFNQLNLGFTQRSTDRCLRDSPTTVACDPVCGNGILEGTEQCDCGSQSECTDPCCNPNTCMLVDGAVCSSTDACCSNTCQYSSAGTQCRAAMGPCDIVEYCPGDSGQCPHDDVLLDGTPCTSNGFSSYCLSGLCPNVHTQCQIAFGSNSAEQRCYDTNTDGNPFGNCAFTGSIADNSAVFSPCLNANVNCGLLQCEAGEIRVSARHGTRTLFGGYQCRTFYNFDDDSNTNAGYVDDGNPCGDGRACLRRTCVPLSDLTNLVCPVGPNGMPCSGNGFCNNRGTCSCNPDSSGNSCQNGVDVNECLTNNGGCAQVCTNTDGSFFCSCNSGFVLSGNGFSCIDINECLVNNGGCAQICNNNAGSFTCACNTGFTLSINGFSCLDINECATSNGGCSQLCTNTAGSFVCSCDTGFTLAGNGRTCNDINECAVNNGGCAVTCENVVGSFRCRCPVGFVLNSDLRSCDDVNECASSNGGCAQVCTNTVGSFTCSCNSGFSLASNGRDCNDVNECLTNNGGCAQQCVNTVGSFQCSCNSGFMLAPDGRQCMDINECNNNNGGCSQICTNTPGLFECSCNPGFSLAANMRDCMAINQCEEGRHNCEQLCTDTGVAFVCSCNTGFTLNADGASCDDINECLFNNGGCAVTCTNTEGSFRCSCPVGFQLNADGFTCSDIDECSINNGGCSQVCTNNVGSYECSCNPGFIVGLDDNRDCENIDECLLGNGGCSQLCIDSEGSFQCDCNTGFTIAADGRTCTAINACEEGSHNCQQLCSSTGSGFECSCNSGFTLNSDQATCADVNECDSQLGGVCQHLCVNTIGSFNCECNPGYQLLDNGISCTNITASLDSNIAPIVGGAIGAIIGVIILIVVVVIITVICVKSKSGSDKNKGRTSDGPTSSPGGISVVGTGNDYTTAMTAFNSGASPPSSHGYKPPMQPPNSHGSQPPTRPPPRRNAPVAPAPKEAPRRVAPQPPPAYNPAWSEPRATPPKPQPAVKPWTQPAPPTARQAQAPQPEASSNVPLYPPLKPVGERYPPASKPTPPSKPTPLSKPAPLNKPVLPSKPADVKRRAPPPKPAVKPQVQDKPAVAKKPPITPKPSSPTLSSPPVNYPPPTAKKPMVPPRK